MGEGNAFNRTEERTRKQISGRASLVASPFAAVV
jgi:hypothetical protein